MFKLNLQGDPYCFRLKADLKVVKAERGNVEDSQGTENSAVAKAKPSQSRKKARADDEASNASILKDEDDDEDEEDDDEEEKDTDEEDGDDDDTANDDNEEDDSEDTDVSAALKYQLLSD